MRSPVWPARQFQGVPSEDERIAGANTAKAALATILRSRTATVLWATLILGSALSMPGCQVGRSFFQMSSDAPLPFFGLDLIPRREKSSPTEGVSRFQDEPVAHAAPSVVSTEPPKSAMSRSWGNLLGRTPKQETLALPVTPHHVSADGGSDAPIEQFR